MKNENDLEAEITKASQELFILQQRDVVQTDIKTIKEAFEQLQQKEHDLYHVFRTLIRKIVIHQDGTVDIAYIFEKHEVLLHLMVQYLMFL